MTQMMPLRYKIYNWEQLSECKSNNSRDLHIVVTHVLDDDDFSGLKISVVHPKYGTLFSHVIQCSGSLVTDDEETGIPHEFSYDELIKELYKYGFDVEFSMRLKLPVSVVEYLMTIRSLKYEKLRIINVKEAYYDKDDVLEQYYIVAFMPHELSNWMNNLYMPSKTEFMDALVKGYACNVSKSPEGKHLNWSWVDGVLNIDDILEEISE